MAFDNIYTTGIASGWKVIDGASLKQPLSLEADVAIIGTGAGGGVAAEILSLAGLKVIMIEEGPLKTSDSFKDMDEARAYRELYQEGAGRATSDGAISILQGRCVGGTTTVNWTSSFRTPRQTLDHWVAKHEVVGHSEKEMAPWFAKMEARLSMAPCDLTPNENNSILQRGCKALGWESHIIPRNVKGCLDSGYCGYGCPVNAKQSMLVTTIPTALANGATLLHRLRVRQIQHAANQVQGLVCDALGEDGRTPSGTTVSVKARHYIVAGGAINSPALLLRSQAPDPHALLGKRTFIHPVNLSVATMPKAVNAFYGTPQSVASDQFQWKDGATGPMGYKLEVPPLAVGITAGIANLFGLELKQSMAQLPNYNAVLALLRDGFVPESEGGQVRVGSDGSPVLDYNFSPYMWDGIRRAFLSMAEIQFAAGATHVRPAHLDSANHKSWKEAKDAIQNLRLEKFRTTLFTAHLMGGCGMSENPRAGVVNSRGRHHQLANLSVMDGSTFPTSLGVNPQLSIYGLVAQNVSALASELGARLP
jgi:choline dehydrogenase